MNSCIICGDDSGFGMICDGCKDAIIFAKQFKEQLQNNKSDSNNVDNGFYKEVIIGNCPKCGLPIKAGQSSCKCGMMFTYS